MNERIAERIMRARWIALVVLLAVALLAASGQGRLGFSTDYRAYLSHDNPELMALEEMQATYDKSDNLLIVLAPASGDAFSEDALAALAWATQQAWQVPYAVRVESAANFQHMESSDDLIRVSDLVADTDSLSAADRVARRDVALTEPTLVNRLVSADGSVAAVNVIYHLPGLSPFENSEVVGAARALAADISERYPDMQVHLTGMAMYNNAFLEAALGDAATLTPLVYLVILITALILLRSVLATLVSVVVVYLSMAAAMGLGGWLGMSLTSLSSSAPLIILMIAVADSVHVQACLLAHLRRGEHKAAALRASLAETWWPITLTSVTTAVAFLSLNFSDMPPFRDLGNMVALGIGFAWLFTLGLVPALVMLLPMKARTGGDRLEVLMRRFGGWVSQRATLLLWVGVPVLVLLVAGASRNELNDQYLRWFDERTDFRQANDFTEERLTGLYTIEYNLKTRNITAITDPGYLADVEAFTSWLRSRDQVVHVASISDTFKRIHQSLMGGDESAYRLPDSAPLAAQSLLLYEQSLPYGQDLNNQIDVTRGASRVVVALRALSTREMLAFERVSLDWLAQHADSLDAEAASTTLIFAHIGQRNIESMMRGLAVFALIVALLMMLAFRSPSLGLLSLLPNIVPAAVALGVWGLLVGQVGFSVAIVVSMTLGIVVDNTIHFMTAVLRHHRAHPGQVDSAIVAAFGSVGPALLITTCTLVLGFLVLGSSRFALNREMGQVTALTLGIALVVDFLMLPGLLKIMLEKRNAKGTERDIAADTGLLRD